MLRSFVCPGLVRRIFVMACRDDICSFAGKTGFLNSLQRSFQPSTQRVCTRPAPLFDEARVARIQTRTPTMLHRLGIDGKATQAILRHSDVAYYSSCIYQNPPESRMDPMETCTRHCKKA